MHPNHGTLEQPSAFWRFCSYVTMIEVAALCRGFLYGASKTEVHGQEAFLKLLESRRDHTSRNRGLITGNPLLSRCFRKAVSVPSYLCWLVVRCRLNG